MFTRGEEQETNVGDGQGRSLRAAVDGSQSAELQSLLTVTGDSAEIEGDFKIADSLHIECEIRGTLEVGGKVVIGEQGVVRADVHTVDALIMGTYEGNMTATGDVEIASTGRVIGNIETDSLVIEKGGFFNGNVEAIEGDDSPARDAGYDRQSASAPERDDAERVAAGGAGDFLGETRSAAD